MAGRPPAFSYPQFKEVHAQIAAAGKDPTYENIRSRFDGKGSLGLIASYLTRLRGEQAALPETAKIPEDLSNQIRVGLMTLHSTLRSEAEATVKVAYEVQAEELMQLGLRQDQLDEVHRAALEVAQRAAQKAQLRLEERDLEVSRLRLEGDALRGELQQREIACSVLIAERDESRANSAKSSAALEAERAFGSSSAQALAVAQERTSSQLEQLQALRAECTRLAAFERDAGEVIGLRALLQVHGEKAELMTVAHAEQQQIVVRLSAENRVLERERDEFRGRADEAQKMHLSSLMGPETPAS